jgi:exo-beta-1,3-glucanase (GH17 family)/cellulose synthase/poly-beta-1,6-N-acetylglucosamine synthase-like glycosyltransferase
MSSEAPEATPGFFARLRRLLFGTPQRRAVAAVLIACTVSALTWRALDQAVAAPDWNAPIRGFSYNPSHSFTEEDHEYYSEERIRADLIQLKKYTNRVRTYSVSRGLDRVPAIATELGMKVALGIWVQANRELTEAEIKLALKVIRENPTSIERVVVGNEVLTGSWVDPDPAKAIAIVNEYIKQVRRELPRRIKVSTAETWNMWEANPALAKEVDVLVVHMLPYWEGISLERAVGHIQNRLKVITDKFPGKPVIIGEAGWPSEGRQRQGASPSVANQAAFVREFLTRATELGWDYYVLEGYDQPWKVVDEGAVGAFWGVHNADGTLKFELTGEIRSMPDWPWFAGVAVVITMLCSLLLLRTTPHLSFFGQLFLAALAGLIVTAMIVVFDSAALQYAGWETYAVFVVVVPVASLAIAVIMAECVEMAQSLWRVQRRFAQPAPLISEPRVSIHVPAYNEPPEMMIETLNALAKLEYANYEVIILDNNTKDPAVWKPVEAHAAKLGPRFRFFHFDGVKGFKAGALNKALEMTDPAAEYVAVIDSDYQVTPDWLKVAIPHFGNPKIALVQGPQDYRDGAENLFKAMAYQEYAGFFRIGMVERNEDNAIIQHGTMTIMRRPVLDAKQWATWCITEDAELGLRIFEDGHESVYIDRSFGKGLIPDTLAAYKDQRYRWAYGAMQIMKRHARALFSDTTELTRSQRYHFVAGWLPWIADALSLLFTSAALVWSALMVYDSWTFDLPMMSLAAIALGLFAVKTGKTLLLYPFRVGTGFKGALQASIAGLALSHTVGKAVWSGLFTSSMPFLRTPKCEDAAPIRQVLMLASEELLLLVLIGIAVFATAYTRGFGDPAGLVWMATLCVQAIPFVATLVMAFISAAKIGEKKPVKAAESVAPAE